MNSPTFLRSILLHVVLLGLGFLSVPTQAASLPESGTAVPGMESLDNAMRTLIAKWKLSGGAIAVAKEGRLVYARGFGYANPATQEPFLPTTSGRIGSASKTFTVTAILRLVERGKLNLVSCHASFLTNYGRVEARVIR